MNDMVLLIEPMIPALRRYARALLRDRIAADDLVQDCLERAINHWSQRRADSNPRAWVFTILHNLAMSQLRRQANQPRHVPIEDAGLPVAAPQEDGLRYRELLQALAQLPKEQRAVLLLVGVEDLSYAEAAKVLGIPVGTVMSRLSRARERLLKIMDGQASAQATHPYLRRVK